ncbi:hypothetical protein B0H67DRAFT_384347 [Lasiosphaeris hirsuta]|uniref:Rhodanese domain-containing protein n=1 Tax=Lasiosphaeris hirsuta TaxID=260670 RepID=A0AA39ZXL0_9PEZI|nr:hypothetical protein B0H67DRAFT_384347 [Lasiosphaeris hirsuta]
MLKSALVQLAPQPVPHHQHQPHHLKIGKAVSSQPPQNMSPHKVEKHGEKPVVVVCAFPASGHTNGLAQVSEYLVKQGFPVYFVIGTEWKASAEKNGIICIENPWYPSIETMTERENIPIGHDRIIFDLKYCFADSTPVVFPIFASALMRARDEHPTRKVVILHETLCQAVLPYSLGAPLPAGYDTLPPVINWSTTHNVATDYNVPPFGPGLPYDPTEENKALWRTIHDAMIASAPVLNDYYNALYAPLGVTRRLTEFMWNPIMTFGDVTLFPTSAQADYPRAGPAAKRYKYIGGLPIKPLAADFVYPEWWPRITVNAKLPADQRKKVALVTQGTVMHSYDELLVPTIRALAHREDLILVATLGAKGAELDPALLGIPVPANTIVVDYLPYDAVLPYADVFVSNAGFNGVVHGIMNAVPMLLAGLEADKGEVCMRAEYAGVAVNLRATSPSEAQIVDGFNELLTNKKYKARAVELQEESKELDPLGTVARMVLELADGTFKL